MLRVPAVADVLNDMTTDVARYRQETPGANAVDASMDMVNARPGQSPSVEALHRQDSRGVTQSLSRLHKQPKRLLLVYRALQELDASTSDRFLRLQDTALEQCQDSDDSDLRRLKKHFKTLKNTFTVYDLKEGFIEGKITTCCCLTSSSKQAFAHKVLFCYYSQICMQDCCRDFQMVQKRTSCGALRRTWKETAFCCASTSLTMSR